MSETERMSWRGGEPADLILRGGRVVDPRAGIDSVHDIVVRAGKVVELFEPGSAPAPDGTEVVEAEGMLALPAFFDPHVHFRTPGEEHKEDLETGSRAAAAGGYCGVVAMANTSPPIDSPAAVSAVRELADEVASIPVGFVATVTRSMAGTELTDMVELRGAGAIGFSDDGLPIRSARIMRRTLQYRKLCGGFISLHEEDPALSGDGAMHEGVVSAELGLAGIPSVSESTMVARDAELALYEDGELNFQHLSAAESVRALAAAKEAGARVTAEVTPHHLVLTDEAVRSLDARFKMNPPLRSEADRQALIEALRSGLIDCVATDHAPHTDDEKESPFEPAPMGVTGLETAFAVLHTELVLPGILELATLVERMTAGAEIVGLDPATLAPGSVANIALIDPAVEWEAGGDGWESRSRNSCFAGRRLTGRVQMTIVRGAVAYRQRSFALGVAQ